ncbi:hypothetical protein SMG44B_60117 [Stenotrophomonas maltophilia]
MPRAGWAGRPTPVLPCAQDSAHEQAATELTWTYLQRPLRDPSPRPQLMDPPGATRHEGLRRSPPYSTPSRSIGTLRGFCMCSRAAP